MNDEKLIPALTNWRKFNGNDFTIEDFIASEGNMSFAIGYSFLFWPEFIEIEDCVIFKNHFELENFKNWKRTDYVKNYGQIESVLNHIHILDLFGTEEKKDEINHQQIKFLGEKMCEIYKAKLKIDFPDKIFKFEFNGNEILEAFDEYELTFYQEKNIIRII